LSPPPDGAAAADVGDINLAAGSARANSGHGGPDDQPSRCTQSGRVLGNRHVLYKYLNPNLLAVATLAKDMKQRRFQLSVWELFAGNGLRDCMNATQPIVGKQSYILPAPVQHLAVSQTERGITAKSVLLHCVLAFLDPRRPFDMTPEFQEEGLMPYHPEVPMSTQAIVNYNQSCTGLRHGLESTSLLFVHGTDLFCTRVQPSKMFDVLKADFDYAFIAAVTIGMIIGSFVTQRLAARKALFRGSGPDLTAAAWGCQDGRRRSTYPFPDSSRLIGVMLCSTYP
uniref:ER membrane protein complex subunit 1 n=1 Tax=Macrostomum lignano TaxID=282301 RepID=A0A1I8FCP9_9PLAT